MDNKTIRISMTISEFQHKQAKEISKDIFGRTNVSQLFCFLLEKYRKEELAKGKNLNV